MNTLQLHAKRLRDLLSTIRHARHAVHASRVHLGRAVKVAHSGIVRVNRAWGRIAYMQDHLEKLTTSNLERLTIDTGPLKDWQLELADSLQEYERIATRELAKAARKADKPPRPRKRGRK